MNIACISSSLSLSFWKIFFMEIISPTHTHTHLIFEIYFHSMFLIIKVIGYYYYNYLSYSVYNGHHYHCFNHYQRKFGFDNPKQTAKLKNPKKTRSRKYKGNDKFKCVCFSIFSVDLYLNVCNMKWMNEEKTRTNKEKLSFHFIQSFFIFFSGYFT